MVRRPVAAASLAAAVVLAGCAQGGNETTVTITGSPDPTPTESTSPAPPQPTKGTKPAGQPRVVDTIATGLEVPWGLDFLPNGDAVVTERDSRRVLLITGPRHRVEQIGTIDEAVPLAEAGLLGVAVSPDFAQDRLLYFYVSTAEDNRVVRAELRSGRLGDTQPVFTGIPTAQIHDGGRLEFGPDGLLYVSTGETGDRAMAQDREALGGKILRITPDGEPAPGNPFDSAIWTWGHRNVQGLAFAGRRLWASEFGDSTYDELNLIEPGDNFGWPEVEGRGGTDAGFVDPQAVWDTDEASPSGLAYTDGYLWMAALRGERIWRIPVDGDRAGEPKAFFVGDFGRMRTIAVAPDGRLWLMTSNRDGRGDPVEADDRIVVIEP